MDQPSAKDDSASPTWPPTLLSDEEVEISKWVARRREDLRSFGTVETWRSHDENDYKLAVVDSIRKISDMLGPQTLRSKPKFAPACQQSIPRDSHVPLFLDPTGIYESVCLVDWLKHFPELCRETLSLEGFSLSYSQEDCDWMASQCSFVLDVVCQELQGICVYQSQMSLSLSSATRVRTHLNEALKEWHELGVNPDMIAEELAAAVLYTLELATPSADTIISNHRTHGRNTSLYGIMNWCNRVFRDSEIQWSQDELQAIEKTIQLFLPLIARIDVFLSRLPVQRTTLFRGIRAHIPTRKYKTGSLIPWTALSSTSADFRTAHRFGYTLFLAHVYNAPAIDFATYFPEEVEHLLPTYTWMKAVSVMSPTLLRILGSSCNYITVQSAGDEPTMDELIQRLVPKDANQLLIYEGFMSRYVEASVHHTAPPLAHDEAVEPLYGAIQSFLANNSKQHLLLLGSGGTGKSSALLAAYCELNRQSRISANLEQNTTKALIPVFISLPSLDLELRGPRELDLALLRYLGISEMQLEGILVRANLVVLMDSLDECGDLVSKWFPLLDGTRFCYKARVIVSCRTEFFRNVARPSVTISTKTKAGICDILHVQPFSHTQVDSFLFKAGLKESSPISVEELCSVGVTPEMQTLPVALKMGVEVARWLRKLGSSLTSVPLIDFECQSGTRIGLYWAYLNTCRFRTEHELVGSEISEVITELDLANTQYLRGALGEIAIRMLAQGTWKLLLSDVRLILEKHFGPSQDAIESALEHSPMRVESLDDPEAEFSFWHKTIGEFICAAAFWGSGCSKYLHMASRGSPFSLREPNVLSFFNELAENDFVRRKKLCGNTLIETLAGCRSLDSALPRVASNVDDANTTLASNTLALLAISQHPLQGMDLSNLVIKNCLIYEASFRNALLDGTRFEDCDLNRSDFNGASMNGVEFIHCNFGALKQPPLENPPGYFQEMWWNGETLLASGLDGQIVHLYEVVTKHELKNIKGIAGRIRSTAWSCDGDLVALGFEDSTIQIWDAASGHVRQEMRGHTASISCLHWSPDGKLIVSGSGYGDETVCVWDTTSGTQVQRFEGVVGTVTQISWDPEGKRIACESGDNTICIFDVSAGREMMKIEVHDECSSGVVWSPNGKWLASGCRSHLIRLWDVASGRQVKVFEGHVAQVDSVCWSPDGKMIASGSNDKTVRFWEVANGREIRSLAGHDGQVSDVCWSPDGELMASRSRDRIIFLWEVTSGHEVKKLDGHINGVNTVCWNRNQGFIASGSRDSTILLWDPVTGREVQRIEGHDRSVNGVDWNSHSNRVASVSDDTTIRIWDAATAREIKRFEGHKLNESKGEEALMEVRGVCWSPHSDLIATAVNDVRIWEADGGSKPKMILGYMNGANSVSWSPDGVMIASGASMLDGILIWTVDKMRGVKTIEGHSGSVNSVCWSPTGNFIASASDDHTVRVWQLVHSVQVEQFNGDDDQDAKWNATNWHETMKLEGHTDRVLSVCWSPNGQFIASGSADCSVRVWDAANGCESLMLNGHSGWINSVCWSSNSEMIISGSEDNTVRVWNIGSISKDAGEVGLTTVCCTLLGRQPAGIPPFLVDGMLGPESLADSLLSFLFKPASSGEVIKKLFRPRSVAHLSLESTLPLSSEEGPFVSVEAAGLQQVSTNANGITRPAMHSILTSKLYLFIVSWMSRLRNKKAKK